MSDLAEFLLARITEDEAAASLEVGRRDVILIGAFAPAFILAECEAKRRIVEEHGNGVDPCDHAYDTSMMGWMCITLRALALPYADHEDYCEEWRP